MQIDAFHAFEIYQKYFAFPLPKIRIVTNYLAIGIISLLNNLEMYECSYADCRDQLVFW